MLTDEQKVKIEENKRQALLRRERARVSLASAPSNESISSSIHKDRIRKLNENASDGTKTYVLYWMQSSHRATNNEALEFAVERANIFQKPLIVAFALTCEYPDANERHFRFMLRGLIDVRTGLSERNIPFLLVVKNKGVDKVSHTDAIVDLAKNAVEVVTDCGYLRILRKWREDVANAISIAMTEIETDVVVPVFAHLRARPNLDTSAASFRSWCLPKSYEHTNNYPDLVPIKEKWTTSDAELARVCAIECCCTNSGGNFSFVMDGNIVLNGNNEKNSNNKVNIINVNDLLFHLKANHGLKETPNIPPNCDAYHVGGELEALRKFRTFLDPTTVLKNYGEHRNDCARGLQSHLAPYIHYGQISVLHIAKRSRKLASMHKEDEKIQKSIDVFLDELIIRRELGIQFVVKKKDTYDTYEALPTWAINSLEKHKEERTTKYSYEDLANSKTDDPLWNAAQNELRITGKMHNYTRMFWGKKVVEWHKCSKTAFAVLMKLNDTYSLDGRDPNSFTGVGWIFGLNDKPFPEAPVMGEVRRMSINGCKKRFGKSIEAYIERWNGNANKGGRQSTLSSMFLKKQKT
jgi:deoxyribodipyrimidine photo-lyase